MTAEAEAEDREMRLRGIIADFSLATETDDVDLGVETLRDLLLWTEELGVFSRLHEAYLKNDQFVTRVLQNLAGFKPKPLPTNAELLIETERALRVLDGKPSYLVPVPDLPQPELPPPGWRVARTVHLESLLDKTDEFDDVGYDVFVSRVEQLIKEFTG